MSKWIQLGSGWFSAHKYLRLVLTLEQVHRGERNNSGNDEQCLPFLIYQAGGEKEECWMFYPWVTHKVADDTGIIFPVC